MSAQSSFYENKVLSPNFAKIAPGEGLCWKTLFLKWMDFNWSFINGFQFFQFKVLVATAGTAGVGAVVYSGAAVAKGMTQGLI